MSETFNIKRGDTSPALLWELDDPDINLAGATVVFNMKRSRDGVVVIARGPAEVVAGADHPTLRYNWVAEIKEAEGVPFVAGDTSFEGIYEAEFEMTFADSSVETTPNASNIVIRIGMDLG